MRANTLRQKLRAGERTIGTRVFNPTAWNVELLGQTAAYDYVEFVAEYGSFHLHDLDNLCRAAELYDLGTMIKVDQSHQGFLAQRAIGAGFGAVLFTDIRSASDARNCVRFARPDTPEDDGLYGAVVRRNTRMGEGPSPQYVEAIRDIVVCVMIEKAGAVEELEQILSVPGIDMVQWGGSDYSMSVGLPGQRTHPEVVAAQKQVFETALRLGIAPRAEIVTVDEAQRYLDMGVLHFSIGVDVRHMYNAWKDEGERLRAIIE